jgi:hypothetical protein
MLYSHVHQHKRPSRGVERPLVSGGGRPFSLRSSTVPPRGSRMIGTLRDRLGVEPIYRVLPYLSKSIPGAACALSSIRSRRLFG